MSGGAYLANYDHDIFVSYAHEEQLGEWTLCLRDELKRALNLILLLKPSGKVVDIWIDEALRKNLPLNDELKRRLEGSALLLIVMSPFYLGSEWCGKEVEWFAAAARSRIASHARMFVVHAWRTELEKWPEPLRQLPGYLFFARHPKANLELPLGLIGDPDDKATFKAVLYNLAGQIKQQIDELVKEAAEPPPVVVQMQLATPPPMSAVPPPMVAAPPRLICLEVVGNSAQAAGVERDVRRVLDAQQVEIFLPADLGPVPRDPLLADRLLQRMLKAKAGCDGLVLVRGDTAAPLGDWLLDYLSEIRPLALRTRADRTPPPPLLIDVAPAGTDAPDSLPVVRWGTPESEQKLMEWVDRLPTYREAAA
jgi:TIR domain